MCQPTLPSGQPTRTSQCKSMIHQPTKLTNQIKVLVGHLVGHLIGRQWGSLFHVHMLLLFRSKVPHFWNFQPILSNIFFVDQPTSPMPFLAANQCLPTSQMVKSTTNRWHRWNGIGYILETGSCLSNKL